MLQCRAGSLLDRRRVVIPGFMRRPLTACEALRLRPLDAAAGANAPRPECIPHRRARMGALPPVFGPGPPFAVGTINFGFALHGSSAYQRQTSSRRSHGTCCFAAWSASWPEAYVSREYLPK